jgi:hypothetical protein
MSDNFLAEVGIVDDTFDASEDEVGDTGPAAEESSEREAATRSGPRRKRRGRQRRRREPEETVAADAEDELPSASESKYDEPARGERAGRERAVEPDEQPSEPRRRRRRRGADRRPDEARAPERSKRETRASRDRPGSARRTAKDFDDDAVEDLEKLEEVDAPERDDAEREPVVRKTRRSIPSWQEAIQDIVSHNLSGRQKPRRPRGGGRGRRPNQRDR